MPFNQPSEEQLLSTYTEIAKDSRATLPDGWILTLELRLVPFPRPTKRARPLVQSLENANTPNSATSHA